MLYWGLTPDNWLHCFQNCCCSESRRKEGFYSCRRNRTKWLVALCWKQQAAVFKVLRENTALEKHQALTANHYSLVLWLCCKTRVERKVIAFLTSAVNSWEDDLKPGVCVYNLLPSFSVAVARKFKCGQRTSCRGWRWCDTWRLQPTQLTYRKRLVFVFVQTKPIVCQSACLWLSQLVPTWDVNL